MDEFDQLIQTTKSKGYTHWSPRGWRKLAYLAEWIVTLWKCEL